MKITRFALLPLLLAAITIMTGACSSESTYSSTTDTHDCVVTSVTLGSLKRYLTTKASDGSDSTYTVSVTGSLYPVFIDQVAGRIYNTDSLPVGTDVSRVVFSNFSTTGVAAIRSLTSEQDTTFTVTDSTDFSAPRAITIYAYDGVGKRTYTVSIAAHQQAADSFVWTRVLTADAGLQALEGAHRSLRRPDGTLLVYGHSAGSPVVLAATEPGSWTTTPLPEGFNPTSVVTNPAGTAYYATTTAGLMTSADGLAWTALESGFVPDALLAAGSTTLVALRDETFYSSTDGGLTWTPDEADEPAMIPATDCRGTVVPSLTDPQLEDFVVVGRCADGGAAVWRRTVDLSGANAFGWYYLPEVAGFDVNCPTVSEPSLLTYDNKTLLTGLDTEGRVAALYLSRDNGRTWDGDDLTSPAAATAGHVSATADAEGYIWLLESSTGSLWRGRYNRLGWDDNPGAFERSRKR